MTEDYQSRLQQAWIGELQGEVYFEALAAHAEDAREKENWLALAELERRVGRVLEPIVDTSADISLESEGIVAAAKGVAALPYEQAVASMIDLLDQAVASYNDLQAQGRPEHERELDILARHEIALQSFAKREVSGDSAGAMDEVNALLVELRSAQA